MANVSSSNGIEKRPNLRFSEFNSNWTSVKLGLAGDFYGGLSGKSKEDFGHGDAKFITYRNVFANTFASDKLLESVYVNQNERQNRVHMGDVLFTQSSETFEEVGMSSVWLHSTEPFLNSFCMGWRPNSSDLNPVFLGYLLRTPTIRKQIICQGQGISRINLAASRISNIDLYHPSPDEQLKIANILSLLDQRIEAVCKIVEHLKKYKRGVVKTLLDPKQNKRNGVVWETDTIGNLGTFIKGAALSKADISDTGTPFILYGELYTTYKEVVRAVVRTTQASVDDVYLSRVGDVVVPTSGETPEEISTASCIMVPDVILAGDLNIYRSTIVDGRIMSYLLNHIVNDQIARVAQGKSVVHVQASEIGKISITYPDHKEQERIAQILELLDNRIAISEMSLNSMQEMKKALLQQLFI